MNAAPVIPWDMNLSWYVFHGVAMVCALSIPLIVRYYGMCAVRAYWRDCDTRKRLSTLNRAQMARRPADTHQRRPGEQW